ncbi:MAG: hypothetical protein JXB07_04675, partial [Anaerolineae bacterium]|nr:hypothetical protein [Anaerolineae bacterium]
TGFLSHRERPMDDGKTRFLNLPPVFRVEPLLDVFQKTSRSFPKNFSIFFQKHPDLFLDLPNLLSINKDGKRD